MRNNEKLPKTLIEAIRYFADEGRCFEFVKSLRWVNGEATCPRCGCYDTSFISTRKIWKCKGCKRQFSLKVGTIFEDSGMGFDKWLPAIWLIVNSKNGISSHELGRALGVTQKTAWFMNHRIRLAMASGTFQKLSGTVESDETYIGGLGKNMHQSTKARRITGSGPKDKVAIHGVVERGGQVVAAMVPSSKGVYIQASIDAWVEPGSTIYTDEAGCYRGIERTFTHEVVNHKAGEYVRGDVHTNDIENFWALYKRAWKGTYTHNAPKHTDRYLAERTFTYNHRELNDLERMTILTSTVAGKTMTYAELKA